MRLQTQVAPEIQRQAGRPRKENSDPVGPNLIGTRSNSLLAEETGESTSQIKRFIRLTYLVPELLEFVDQDRIKMRPAVELSYLDEDCQRDIVDEIDMNDATPSHDQNIRMRKFFEEGKLTTEVIQAIMSEEKPNQKESLSEILGHATVNITMNRYVHTTLEMKKENMQKLSNLLAVK